MLGRELKPSLATVAKTIRINRAPVLTLWAAVVAERLGFRRDEALTLGKALAGLNAYSKGVSLGLFEPASKAVREQRRAKAGKQMHVDLMHRAVPVMSTPDGLRALVHDKPITPESVERYLAGKFGDDLDAAAAAMRTLAKSMPSRRLAKEAYRLYEGFRSEIPAGAKGWGVAGNLNLDALKALARAREPEYQANCLNCFLTVR